MIQRYRTCAVGENGVAIINAIEKDDNGPLVKWEDVKKLQAENAALQTALVQIVDAANEPRPFAGCNADPPEP